jgi:hypothetical protein
MQKWHGDEACRLRHMEIFVKRGAVVRTKRMWLHAGSAAALGAMLLVGMGTTSFPLLLLGALALQIAVPLWQRTRSGTLGADGAGVRLDDKILASRSSVRSAQVLRRAERTYVHLERFRGAIDVFVDDEAEGRALIGAMRLDAASALARYRVYMGLLRTNMAAAAAWTAVPLVTLALAWGHNPLLPYALVQLAAFLAVQLVRTASVTVGADGVWIRPWLARGRFISFAHITSVEASGANVHFCLNDGREVTMSKETGRGHFAHAGEDHAKGLAQRVAERVQALRDDPGKPPLARASRSAREWLRDLGAATDETAHYRTGAIPREDLWRLVEDASVPATTRAGAAIALRSGMREGESARLRAAAEACAAPRLRVALDTVASRADDEALAEALDRIDDEETTLHRSKGR